MLLLQVRRQMTAAQLAAELHVSVRTIYRDIESLGLAGVPIYGEPGIDGGYRLIEGYRTNLTGLSSVEANVLLLSGVADLVDRLGLGVESATAQRKLLAALPREHGKRASALRAMFHLDAVNWYHDADAAPHLATVVDGMWRQRSLRLVYSRWAAPSRITRTVDPFGVVLKSGVWYLVAGSPGGTHTYRISEIESLEVLETEFERPYGFDLAEHWRNSVTDFNLRRYQDTAVVRISERGLTLLAQLRSITIMDSIRRDALADTQKGWHTVTVPVESIEHASHELMALGAEVQLIAPEPLRAALAATAGDLAALYATAQ